MTLHPISGKSYLSLLLLLCASLCAAQNAVVLSPVPQTPFIDGSGRALSFGCVFTYKSQSTNQLATYSDQVGLNPNSNPVILNAAGVANIWLQAGQAYTFLVKSSGGSNCSLGQTIYSVDGVGGGASQLTSLVTASGGTANFPVQSQNQLFTITLTGNVAAQPVTFTGVIPPALITFQITQDGAGAHTFTWPTNVTDAVVVDSAASHTTSQTFLWNGSSILAVGGGYTSAGQSILPGGLTLPGAVNAGGAVAGQWLQSNSPNVAASGAVRLAKGDTACWRNNANAADVCVSLDASDRLVLPSTVATSLASTTANPASSGIVRLAKTDTVCWRNNANSGNICVSLNGSDQLVLPTIVSPTFAGGVGNDGSGYKHKRFGATCTTAASAGSFCTTTYSWTTAFADTSYTAMCTPVGPTNTGVFSLASFNAAGVTVEVVAGVAAAASYSSVDCIGVHD